MAKELTRLGRGLDSLIPKTSLVTLDGVASIQVLVSDITYNPRQPRKNIPEESLKELSESIQEHGLAQPIIVRKKPDGGFELIAGERRLRAFQIAGIDQIPAIIRDVNDEGALELSLIENIQREDLTPVEQAASIRELSKVFSLTQEEIAKKLGKSRSAIANLMRLNDLPDAIKQSLLDGEITEGHARAILSLDNPDQQIVLWKRILRYRLNVRDVEREVTRRKKLSDSKKAQPAELADIRNKLSDFLGTWVNISGDLRRGKIEIKYTSFEDLLRITEKMGCS